MRSLRKVAPCSCVDCSGRLSVRFRRFTKGCRADNSCHRCARRSRHQLCMTTSNLSRAAILPSDDLNESMAKILFSMRTSVFVRISAHRRNKRVKCPLLAQSGPRLVRCTCLLLGVKRYADESECEHHIDRQVDFPDTRLACFLRRVCHRRSLSAPKRNYPGILRLRGL